MGQYSRVQVLWVLLRVFVSLSLSLTQCFSLTITVKFDSLSKEIKRLIFFQTKRCVRSFIMVHHTSLCWKGILHNIPFCVVCNNIYIYIYIYIYIIMIINKYILDIYIINPWKIFCNPRFHEVFCKTIIIRQLRIFLTAWWLLFCKKKKKKKKLHETQGCKIFPWINYIYI